MAHGDKMSRKKEQAIAALPALSPCCNRDWRTQMGIPFDSINFYIRSEL
jgi:hypothetical protein